MLVISAGQVAQGAVGLHQLVVGLPDPGHPLGGGAAGCNEAGAPVVGRVVKLAHVVEHRPAGGDGVSFSDNRVGCDILKRYCSHVDAFLTTCR